MTISQSSVSRKLLLFVAALTLLCTYWMLRVKPVRYGDGQEYLFMIESLRSHGTPELRQTDIEKAASKPGFSPFNERYDENWTPYFGYFQSLDGSWYSQHFWAYSLACLPIRFLLEIIHKDTRMAMQMTNAALFAALLWFIALRRSLTNGQKLLAILLTTCSPFFWFLHWTHSEVYLYVMVSLALVLAYEGSIRAAILCASFAAVQNQAITVLVGLLVLRGIVISWKTKNWRIALGGFAAASISTLSPLYYWFHFGRPSLIAPESLLPKWKRMLELLFGLDLGMLPFIPIALLLMLGLVAWATWKEHGRAFETQIFVALLTLLASCSSVDNWNAGTVGPSRYVVWMLPLVFLPLVLRVPMLWSHRWARGLLVIGVALQAAIVGSVLWRSDRGFPTYVDNDRFSSISKFTLNHLPSLYNPDFQTFCERTLGGGAECLDPTVFRVGDKCRKAAVTCNGLALLKEQCGAPTNEPNCSEQKNGTWQYVNY